MGRRHAPNAPRRPARSRGGNPRGNGPALKLLALLLAALCLLFAAACASPPVPEPAQTPVVTPSKTPEPAPAPAPTPSPAPSPTATLAPAPSPTIATPPAPTPPPAPAPSPTIALSTPPPAPPISEVDRLTAEAMTHVRWLSETLGPRPAGSQQEEEAARHIAGLLADAGLQVDIVEFPILTPRANGATLTVEGVKDRSFSTAALLNPGAGPVTGPLVDAGSGTGGELSDGSLEGVVALVPKGEVSLITAALNANRRGALGLVVYNDAQGPLADPLPGLLPIPVVGLSKSDGEHLSRLLAGGAVTVTLGDSSQASVSRNVVASTGGGGDAVIVLGAHYDTTPESPGANDNATGMAILLTLARELAQRDDLPVELRFIAFGAEEVGLFGSIHYVNALSERERGRVIAMLNFDSTGSGNLQVAGDPLLLRRIAAAAAEEQGLSVSTAREIPGTTGDHVIFENAGAPVALFFADDLSRIHTPNDMTAFIQPRHLGETVLVALAVIASLTP